MLSNNKNVSRSDFEKIRHFPQPFRLELLQIVNQNKNLEEVASKYKISMNTLYLIQYFRQEILYDCKYNMEPENRLSLDQIENLVAINKILEELWWRLKHTTQPHVSLGDEDVLKKAFELKQLFGIEEFAPCAEWLKKLQINLYRPPRNPQHNESTDMDSILSDLKWEITPRIFDKFMKIKNAANTKRQFKVNITTANSNKNEESNKCKSKGNILENSNFVKVKVETNCDETSP